jgi:hypothetical protein
VKVLVATPEPSEWNGLPVNTAAGLEAGLIERIDVPDGACRSAKREDACVRHSSTTARELEKNLLDLSHQLIQSRATGNEWLSPRHFPHGFHIMLKTLNSNQRVRLIPVQ